MRFLLLFLFISGLIIQTQAQKLKQKASFGIVPQEVIASIAQEAGLERPKGAIIQQVFPNSTAAQMGILEKDIILKVNDREINNLKDIYDYSQNLKADEDLQIAIIRNKQMQILKGKALARPILSPKNATVQLDEFSFDGDIIRCALYKPNKNTNSKTIYFLQGYTCQSILYTWDGNPYDLLFDDLINKGYTLFFVEKPGIGDCDSALPCSETGFDKELAVFEKGYQKLLSYTNIDKQNIFLFGHSLGGIVAPLLAEKYQPKGVIVYGTVLKKWHDYMLDIATKQKEILGVDMSMVYKTLPQVKAVFKAYFDEKKSPQQIISQDATNYSVFQNFMGYDGKEQVTNRHYKFWQEINMYDLEKSWVNVSSYVLTIFGEVDIAAIEPHGHQQIVDIVNKQHPNKAQFYLVPKTDHLMIEVGTMNEYLGLVTNNTYGQVMKTHFNHAIPEKIDIWIKSTDK